MKKKIVNVFLMLALIASSMGTFVSCKDYDEDAYVDLRNRISNEVSLRETLENQVKNLKEALAALEEAAKKHVTYDELNKKLEAYLTKDEAAKTYVTLSEYNLFVTNYQTWKIDIDNAIKDLRDKIANIEKNMATKDDLAALASQIEDANKAASEALGKANDAYNLGKDNEKRIEALEELVGKLPTDWPEEFNPSSLWEAIKLLQETVAGLPDEIKNVNIRVDSLCAVIDGYAIRIELLEQNFDSLSNVVSIQGDQILKLQEKIIEIQQEWNTKIDIVLNQAIAVSDEAKQLAQDALKKATEALLAAEAANAKASNAEQLALNAFYMAQEACEIAKKTAEDMEAAIKRAEDAAAKAEAAQKKAEDAQKECEKILEEMKAIAATGCKCPADLEERLKKAENDAAMALETAKAADAKADKAKEAADKAKEAADKAKEVADEAKAKNDEQDKSIADLYDKLSKIVSGNCTCGDMKDEVKDAAEKAEEVAKKADELEKAIAGIEDALKSLKADIDGQIYGIEVQGSENPVFGYLNAPFDVRSNLLMSYYYCSSDGFPFAFPAAGGTKWVNADEDFTDEEIAIMTNGGTLAGVAGFDTYDSSTGIPKESPLYLGRVFMNINPASTDFTGKTVTLINSQGAKSPVSLNPIRVSDKYLTFGYDRSTRAGVGFYDAEAYINNSDVNQIAVNSLIGVEELMDRAKAIIKKKSKEEAVNLVADIYNSLDNRIAANALKATWTDSEGKEKSVISDFAVGAAVVKPLSFNTLNLDRLKKGLPGKSFINKWIEKIIKQIKIKFPSINAEVQRAIDEGKFSFDTVETLKKDQVVIVFTATVNGLNQKYEVTINLDQDAREKEDWDNFVKDATIEASKSGHDVSVEVAYILNDALPHAWNASIEQAKLDMINSMKKYVEDAFTKLNGYFKVYELFDINLVAHESGKGWAFVSQITNAPTTITSATKLYPTSNTTEYFAPAYKKYIAISNVYDAATGAAVADAQAKAAAAAGENMNQVISGDQYVTVNGEAGLIYEISYAAVDYRGYKTRQKFYVQF